MIVTGFLICNGVDCTGGALGPESLPASDGSFLIAIKFGDVAELSKLKKLLAGKIGKKTLIFHVCLNFHTLHDFVENVV